MAIDRSRPMPFAPRGLVDAFDASGRFPGACRRLQNLVFDNSNPDLVITRPGITQLISFLENGFTAAGFISVHVAIGTRIYGMIATSRFAGKDEPFCFDTATGLFVTISGVTNATTPTSPATFGDWTPPTMTVVGVNIIVTHTGFAGTPGVFFGLINISVPATPAWSAANTVTQALPAVPTAVANFNNRAYFVVNGNRLYYTDVLTSPPTITNATQVLVVGDTSPITALAGLPLQTTSSGILQSLTVFKDTQIWQITGDTTTSNLALQYMSLVIGTSAPRSVVQAPQGLYFAFSAGPYVIGQLGILSPVTYSGNETEPDILQPFSNATTPSRWAASYNSNIYRVCGPTVISSAQTTSDYWFDEHRRRWNGPHTIIYDCASAVGGYFVLSSAAYPGVLLQSPPLPTASSAITDLGLFIPTVLLTSTFPKTGDMARKQVAESQIELGAINDLQFNITAQDEIGDTLDYCITYVTPVGQPWGVCHWGMGTLWTADPHWDGGSLWDGGGRWDEGVPVIPRTYPVPWTQPFVFEKMALRLETNGLGPCQIGAFFARYQQTGYMQVRR